LDTARSGHGSGENFLARKLLVDFIRNRFAARSARRGIGGGWGSGGRRPVSRRSSYGGFGSRGRSGYSGTFGRPRRRSQVRVTGCCLPIPLGVVALTAAGTTRRARSRAR